MAVRSVVIRYSADMTGLLRDLDKAALANDKMAASSAKAGKALDARAVAAGGIGLALGVAIAKFAEFDKQMSAVAAATGATGDELGKLRDAAVKAGADTQFSATEAADAITELAKAGLSTADILGGGLTGALNLAAAGMISTGDAAETMASALAQFNLDGSQASHVADLLAAGAGKAQGSVGDMGQALKQAGLVAASTGLSIEETTGGLTAFANAGLIGSDAGTSFKSMLQRLVPQSDEAAELMKKLGINAFDAQGNFKGLEEFAGNLQTALKNLTPEQRNAALATIFGSDAVRAANVLYNEGAAGIHKWTEAVDAQGFAARQAAKLTDNLSGDVERLSGSLDTVFVQAGSGANNVLRTLTQALEGAVNLIGAIPGPALTAAAALGGIALLGPKIKGVGDALTGSFKAGVDHIRLAGAYAAESDKPMRTFASGLGLMSKAGAGLKGALSGAVGILGGPWGIALTAATIGLTAFATAQDNANKAGQEFADTLDEQTGALTNVSRAFVGKKLTADISGDDLKKLQQLGINLAQVTDLTLKGGPELAAYIDHLRDMANTSDSGAVLSALASSMENTNEDAERGKAVWQGYQAAIADTAGSANAAEGPISKMGAAVDATAPPAERAEAALKGYNDAVTVIIGNIATMGDATDELTQLVQDNAQKQADATKDPKDSWGDYADTVKLSAKDIIKTLDEQTKAAEKFRDNLLIVQKRGDAQFTEWVSKQPAAVAAAYATGTAKEKQGIYDAFKRNVGAQQGAGVAAGLTSSIPTIKDAAGTVWTATKDKLTGQIIWIPTKVSTPPTSGAGSAAAAEEAARRRLPPIPIYTYIVPTANKPRIGSILNYAGGFVRAYAAGGADVPNLHQPQIARSGTVRIWAEPETQGEGYVPLANDWRRPRAKAITQQIVTHFGGQVQWNAAGSIMANSWPAGAGGSGVSADLVKAIARQVGREVSARIPRPVYSGQDAHTAARSEQRTREWEIMNG